MPPLSVLIKPASSACNMNCSYCFYKDVAANRERGFAGYMTMDTLEKLIASALDYADRDCTFLFQGGEPTLAGLGLYRAVLELERKYAKKDVRVFNAIQTNGYLIDEQWAEFLASNGFLVGLSLDGPADVHNGCRKDLAGKDTFNRVMNAAHLLDRAGAEYNILSVVTAQSAKRAESIYNFFKKHRFKWLQFIPCLEPLNSGRDGDVHSMKPDEYGRFLIRIFDLWYADLLKGQYVSIRHIDNWLHMLLGSPPEACSMNGRCSIQFVVEGDGRVYPCDFYVLDEYCLGRVGEQSFDLFSESDTAAGFVSASCAVPEECAGCPVYRLCRNGCRRERISQPDGSVGLNYYCNSYKQFFEARGERLYRAAEKFLPNG